MKNLQFIILVIFIFSCHKETTYVAKTFFNNETSINIKIIPFYKGEPFKAKIISIEKGTKSLVLSKSGRGKGGGETFAEEISFCDSLRVIYNVKDSICHYNPMISTNNINFKGIYFDNSRSLYKRENYIRKIISEDKNSINNEYSYTFTEQDYINAKND